MKINLGLVALGLVYFIFLKKQSDFRWQRMWLIGGGLLIMIIPLLPPLQTFQAPQIQWINLGEVVITPTPTTSAAQNPSSFSWLSILGIIYFAGVIFLSTKFLVKLFFLIRLIRRSKFLKEGQYRINTEPKNLPTFSFLHWIFLGKSAKLQVEEKEQILTHEKEHTNKAHTLDLLFMEWLVILNWFNPIVYYLRNQLTLLHEFEADAAVIKKYDRKNYSMLMAVQAFNLPGPILSHTFQNSFILKRIAMLKIQRRKITRIQGAFMLLMVGMIGFGLSCESTPGLFAEPDPNLIINDGDIDTGTELVYMKVDTSATYEGGWEEWFAYLNDHIQYPEEARKKGIEGRVFLKFIVNEDGRISNVEVQRGIGGGCDEAAVNVLRDAPNFIPAKFKGEPVKSWMSLAINFRLGEDDKGIGENY